MRTFDAKAKDVCYKLKLPDDGAAFSSIRLALKEQDRDTRHACAEAVDGCGECETSNDNAIYKGDASIANSVIDRDEAHGACMNAKAG